MRELRLHIFQDSMTKKITQMKAIRLKCLDCAGSFTEVKNCPFEDCPLFKGRFGKRPKGFRTLKAIRQYCIECMGNNSESRKYVRECSDKDCPLWPFRFGVKMDTYIKRREKASKTGKPTP